MDNGLIQVYTGNGKGKTTAAIGLAVRANSAGLKVAFIYFNKTRDNNLGEHIAMEKLGINVKFFAEHYPSFFPDTDIETMQKTTQAGIDYIKQLLSEKQYDLIILDEILISVRDNFIKENTLLDIMKSKPDCTELILTGRSATENIINNADLVSEIKAVKHPSTEGVKWRKGIEK
jgi:cob(I)alamin adenosyltransferase